MSPVNFILKSISKINKNITFLSFPFFSGMSGYLENILGPWIENLLEHAWKLSLDHGLRIYGTWMGNILQTCSAWPSGNLSFRTGARRKTMPIVRNRLSGLFGLEAPVTTKMVSGKIPPDFFSGLVPDCSSGLVPDFSDWSGEFRTKQKMVSGKIAR